MKRATTNTEPTTHPNPLTADTDMRAATDTNLSKLCQPTPEGYPLQIPITSLPLYIDGSEGSMWQARECWSLILAEYPTTPTQSDSPLSHTRFVRLSDLLELLTKNNIMFK